MLLRAAVFGPTAWGGEHVRACRAGTTRGDGSVGKYPDVCPGTYNGTGDFIVNDLSGATVGTDAGVCDGALRASLTVGGVSQGRTSRKVQIISPNDGG